MIRLLKLLTNFSTLNVKCLFEKEDNYKTFSKFVNMKCSQHSVCQLNETNKFKQNQAKFCSLTKKPVFPLLILKPRLYSTKI